MQIWEHWKTVHRHRALVRKYCFRLGLYWQGLTHNLSKYSPVEFWTDYSLDGSGIVGVEMPKKYVAEMFCDRLAASKVYRGDAFSPGDPYQFFLRGKGRRLLLHPATEALLETLLQKLQDDGEDAAFDYIRKEMLGK